jgi:putative nucleic acid binding protein
MRKKYILIAAIFWVALIGLAYYFYTKPHSSAANQKTDVHINASELYEQFQRDESAANTRFTDKIIEVKGKVAEIQHNGIRTSLQLDAGVATGGINCSLADGSPNLQVPPKGTLVTIKGKCSGFLMDVNLVDCVVQQ